jgi:hypothetical protein
MAAPSKCPHCNGTSVCGGFKHRGTLMTKPACPTCTRKSGLHPKGNYHNIVCSVCAGEGVILPGALKRSLKRSSNRQLLIAAPFVLVAILLAIVGILVFSRGESSNKQIAKQPEGVVINYTFAELQAKITPGMSKEQVIELVAKPDPKDIKEIPGGLSNLEMWTYRCTDGSRAQVTFFDGKVTGVKSQ